MGKRLSLPDGSQWRLTTDGVGVTCREAIGNLDRVDLLKLADEVDPEQDEPQLVPDHLVSEFTSIPVAGDGSPAGLGQLKLAINGVQSVNAHVDQVVSTTHGANPGQVLLTDDDLNALADRVITRVKELRLQ